MRVTAKIIRNLLTPGVLLAMSSSTSAQVVLEHDAARLTLEGWANAEAAVNAADARADGDDWQLDAAVRALGLYRTPHWGRIGARIVAEGRGGAEDDTAISERSLIWTGRYGRLEYGDRPGLPDVLTGFAPNPFTFTTAEFGPASGPSLDPGGGIVQRFVSDELRSTITDLSVLGYATSMFDDRSRKLIYVSPRAGGWLGGVSYASQADGDAAQALFQAGAVHETYRQQNVLRIGGSWAQLRSDAGESLDSYSVGASYSWDEIWLLGASVTWNPDDSSFPVPGWRSDAAGATASLNYNRGPWTTGALLQYARGREAEHAARDRLRTVEAGLSYRTSTKLRVFAAWYRYLLEIGSNDTFTADNLIVVGLRMTL